MYGEVVDTPEEMAVKTNLKTIGQPTISTVGA
jgi:hypothetical protein